ncbi:MAG TPA: hypothetical protein VLL25_17095 [Acidimicrobiales bacterium]|nr:hypothetical protein [Acidimicrobiales bacterium]
MTADEGADSKEIRPTRMAGREQQAGYAIAALGVVVSIALGASSGNFLLSVVGVVAAAGLAVSAYFGHRIVTAFVAILIGFVPIFTVPGEFVLLGYGGYLMFRSSRAQAKLNASRPRLTPQQRREARQARKASKTGGAAPTIASRSAKPLTPNRRYTPPKTKSGRRR